MVGGLLELSGIGGGRDVWAAAVAILAAELAIEVVHTVLVEHHMGVDTIALVAMVGSLAFGQERAGMIVGLMFTGGAALEDLASTRARRELTALLERAPKVAQLRRGDDIERCPSSRSNPAIPSLVRTGEVVPVDGTVIGGEAVRRHEHPERRAPPGDGRHRKARAQRHGQCGPPFELRATRAAAESAYAAVVRLVQQAQAQRAPFVRMADRYAGFFLPATLIVAGAAWALSGDPVRALAVVVVATPCPLILAAPIAFVSGLSRAARPG